MKPGDLFLEKYKLDELEPDEKIMLEKRFEDPQDLKNEVEKLEASDREILEKYKPADMAGKIEALLVETDGRGETETDAGDRKRGPVIIRFKAIRYTAIAAAAALAVIIGITSYTGGGTSYGNLTAASDTTATERVKGLKPSMKIYRRTPDSAEILKNRDYASEKDLLQIEYIAGSFRYGVIFSIDGRGVLTMHYPTYEGIAAELDHNGAILLPYAYELDDAPEFERFFFVTGGSDFDIDEVLDAAHELAASSRSSRRRFLDIPDSYFQTTILLRKEAN